MKLTCPACSARYTLATERLGGRRATVRCKRCGESFAVDASQSGEVYASASTGAPAQASPFTGERNESSVLFSLSTLAKHAPAPNTPAVTESSALIDIRALVSAGASTKADASAPRADDIVNLGGGGAFAPLFGDPLAPPVTFAPDSEGGARRSKGAIVIGATALVVVAMVGLAAIAGVRSKADAPSATAATPAPSFTAAADVPAAAPTSPDDTAAPATHESPQTTGTQRAAPGPARAGTTSTAARSAPQAPTTTTTTTTTTTGTANSAKPVSKCCPGESEMACQMRLSAGAACAAEPPGSTAMSAPPFDRSAAARALGVDVTSCKRADGPTGAGHVKVTFQPSGSVSAVTVDAPFAGTARGACIAQRYRSATVPTFARGPLSVGKTFAIE